MADKLKLTTIGLTTKDGKRIELDVAEARDLYNQLHELFGRPSYIPTWPIIIERDRYPWAPPYRPWWQDQTTSAPGGPIHRPTITCQSGNGLIVEYAGDGV